MSGNILVAMAAVGAVGLFLLASAWAARRRRRRIARGQAPGAEPQARRLEQRVEAVETRQAELATRLASGASEEKLQAMAGSLLALVRDKNAAMETALAGMDQLRARLRTLEQMGDAAEARALFEGLGGRLDAVQTAQATGDAALQARVAALEAADPGAGLAGQFARLMEHKDAATGALLERLGPLETALGALRSAQAEATAGLAALRAEAGAGAGPFAALAERLERQHARRDVQAETLLARIAELETAAASQDPRAALDAFAVRLEAVQSRLTILETPAENPFAEISEQLTRLYAQKDAAVETVLTRLAPLEARLAGLEAAAEGRDPGAALDAFAGRLEAMQARVAALETPGENPFAEISGQLTRLYAQKDAAVDTVLARLAPLEARLAGLETAMETRDPRPALDAFAARLEAVQDRLSDIETPGENPFAEISGQLARLYAQKDAAVEAVLTRLAPLETRLASLEVAMETRDPRAALDAFAGRLEAVQAAHATRLAALEAPGENPFAEISEQLTRLYAQKDATVEAVFARLAPLEARLAGLETAVDARDPRAALDAFAARLEAVQTRLADLETPGENPFAEISEQLTRLYAQKDAAVETVLVRLAPLEARLAGLETAIEGRDPRAALDAFAMRLEAVQARLVALEAPDTTPIAGITEQLDRLRAEKDATAETVLARLAPLEARLAAVEADDPRAALAEIAARIAALQDAQGAAAEGIAALHAAAGEGGPFAEIADQLARLYAQKDAAAEAVLARVAPLEARLAELEARPADTGADEARAEAQAIAAQMIALRAAAAQTELFADRLALLEASLPRLSAAQALMLQALERQGVPVARRADAETTAEAAGATPPLSAAGPAAAAAPAASGDGADPLADLPRVVSLHHQ